MCMWPLADDVRQKLAESTKNWTMLEGNGRYGPDGQYPGKAEFFETIVRNLKAVMPETTSGFGYGCRTNQEKKHSNPWLMLWHDDLKCIHAEVDVRNRRQAPGTVLIGVHVEEYEENRDFCDKVGRYLRQYVRGVDPKGDPVQLFGYRVAVDKLDKANALKVAAAMRDMIGLWVPRLREAILHREPGRSAIVYGEECLCHGDVS